MQLAAAPTEVEAVAAPPVVPAVPAAPAPPSPAVMVLRRKTTLSLLWMLTATLLAPAAASPSTMTKSENKKPLVSPCTVSAGAPFAGASDAPAVLVEYVHALHEEKPPYIARPSAVASMASASVNALVPAHA